MAPEASVHFQEITLHRITTKTLLARKHASALILQAESTS
jgi:hypothetical protein